MSPTRMNISELQPKQGKVDIEAAVTDVSPARTIAKPGFSGQVQEAVITDGTGSISLSLWNEHVNMLKAGDRVKIVNGYVNEFQGKLQLSPGKFGTLTKLE